MAAAVENSPSAASRGRPRNNDDVCKYCRQGETNDRPLFYPCKCSGTMMYVHEDCLKRWLETSQSNKCEVCGFIFRFKSIWKQNTPDSLPVSEIMQGLYKSFVTALSVTFHRSLVIFMWGVMLPLATAILYETAFPENENDTGVVTRLSKMFKLFNLTYQILRLNVSPADWYTGLGVVVFNCITVIGMLYLREQLLQVIERTRNEQRERIRDQVEQDNRQLNNAIQNALNTVQQIRNAERNIEMAARLGNIDTNENENDNQNNPENELAANQRDFSFTDDEEVDNRPYPRVDNVRIMRHLGSGDDNTNDLDEHRVADESSDENDPLYDGEYTPNSGSSYDYSDDNYRKCKIK